MTEPQSQNPEEEITKQKNREEMTSQEKLMDSINFVVDMMNSGKVNAKDVYPPGRYHGD